VVARYPKLDGSKNYCITTVSRSDEVSFMLLWERFETIHLPTISTIRILKMADATFPSNFFTEDNLQWTRWLNSRQIKGPG
jgi:hypothetical protein